MTGTFAQNPADGGWSFREILYLLQPLQPQADSWGQLLLLRAPPLGWLRVKPM